ncbi:GTP cyclohydrolase II [Palleronia caenipelagi]|uniref:GTP cyclohydrolase-2 n=1 Tax=Palleronia caenipelagi TaxID=2489174 RepID=A0A547Q0A6_9RHOB|nr:GTP cyclohydrolase II [Palleronia caenipelagi]TRD19841.1 GTP cyclohydrolase II [Palleronia caenipelagi]
MDIFAPNLTELYARARSDMLLGLPVCLSNDGCLWLAGAVERLSDARIAAMRAGGKAELALTHLRAETLRIRVYDNDLTRITPDPLSSAAELRDLVDPGRDLNRPLMGPFQEIRGGVPDVARLALRLAKAAQLLPAVLLCPIDTTPKGVTVLELGSHGTPTRADIRHVVNARLPITATPAARLHVFRPDDGSVEHYAIEIGQPDRTQPVLARLHSACFTGDVLGSLKCDCGPQLHAALDKMAAAGGGILVYLNQEGRGIGLANKMRAYALQDRGFDTVEANHRLGYDDDERDFTLGARILSQMGIRAVRLMTNNPRKVRQLETQGITVAERVPLWTPPTAENAAYLRVKATKSGHLK